MSTDTLVSSIPEKLDPAKASATIADELNSILEKARKKAELIAYDQYGIKTIILNKDDEVVVGTNNTTEVRFFRDDPATYHRIKIEDVLNRVNFLADVAEKMLEVTQGEHDPAIEALRKAYIERAKHDLAHLTPENIRAIERANGAKDGPSFDSINGPAKQLFADMQRQLMFHIAGISGDPGKQAEFDISAASKQFDQAAKEHVIEIGRPNIVQVMGNGLINAEFTKGDKTYPSNYRASDKAGVNPNAVFEITAIEASEGNLKDISVVSRAASYSVLDLSRDKKLNRISLNYENAKADTTEVVKRFIAGQNLDKTKVYEMDMLSTSLLTPHFGKRIEGVVRDVLYKFGIDYKPETRQLKDHHRALAMLNAEIIEVDGIKVKLNIIHQNYPVNTDGKHWDIRLSHLQETVTRRGFAEYAQKQQSSLRTSLPEYASILYQFEPSFIMQDQIKLKQQEINQQYQELRGLAKAPDTKVNDYRAANHKVDKLERELAVLYKQSYAEVAKQWKDPRNLKDLELFQGKIISKLSENKNLEETKSLQQLLYYLDVQKQYYTGEYKKRSGIYSFIAKISRSAELGGSVVSGNCKSSKDRTGWLCNYRNLLIQAENDKVRNNRPLISGNTKDDQYLEKHLPIIHERSAGLEAIGKNAPGARGNRQNRYGDKSDIDRSSSPWQKIKYTKADPLKEMIKEARKLDTLEGYMALRDRMAPFDKSGDFTENELLIARNAISERFAKNVKKSMPDILLGDGSLESINSFLRFIQAIKVTNVSGLESNVAPYRQLAAFADIENPYLRAAIIKLLFNKISKVEASFTIGEKNDVAEAVKKINHLFSKEATLSSDAQNGYPAFLQIVEKISSLHSLKHEFIASIILHKRNMDFSSSVDPKQIDADIENLQARTNKQTNLLRRLTGIYTPEQKSQLLAIYQELASLQTKINNAKESLHGQLTLLKDAFNFISPLDKNKAEEIRIAIIELDKQVSTLTHQLAQIQKLSGRIASGINESLQQKHVANNQSSETLNHAAEALQEVIITPKTPAAAKPLPLEVLKGIYVEPADPAKPFEKLENASDSDMDEIKPSTLHFTVSEQGIAAIIPQARLEQPDHSAIEKMLTTMVEKAIHLYGAKDVNDLNIESKNPALFEMTKKILTDKLAQMTKSSVVDEVTIKANMSNNASPAA